MLNVKGGQILSQFNFCFILNLEPSEAVGPLGPPLLLVICDLCCQGETFFSIVFLSQTIPERDFATFLFLTLKIAIIFLNNIEVVLLQRNE